MSCPTPATSVYNRDDFGDWIDEDGDGEDTRWEVLVEENVGDVGFIYSNNAKQFQNPKWICPYSGNVFTDPGELDIDHLVPVKEAWVSGACFWDEEKRVRYYNFLADPNHLLAVDLAYNRQKGSQDPVAWKPTNSFEQNYLLYWSQVKANWGLTADAEEYDFLLQRLGDNLPSSLKVTTCGCE